MHDELTAAYGQGVVSCSTVAYWIHRFSSERELLDGDPRNGRPLSVINQQNIEVVQDLANDDPYISINYIATILDTAIS
ncbi:unnamed protein product [Rotaria sp. Silwood2]|nr:unnamed protein product [Rotaria sp. Silwood2]CAF3094376.1 unnamed protein product [Rotaria sp. Silwood2]CAF3465619.1 unnamed protein product [Rotaria sp. Silwood2]CAF4390938.1 unnamed protein product [Rotaria sp. Silwood2]CAF4448657.1 unnamed protein product [Rotaria sp. Silwood2]